MTVLTGATSPPLVAKVGYIYCWHKKKNIHVEVWDIHSDLVFFLSPIGSVSTSPCDGLS